MLRLAVRLHCSKRMGAEGIVTQAKTALDPTGDFDFKRLKNSFADVLSPIPRLSHGFGQRHFEAPQAQSSFDDEITSPLTEDGS